MLEVGSYIHVCMCVCVWSRDIFLYYFGFMFSIDADCICTLIFVCFLFKCIESFLSSIRIRYIIYIHKLHAQMWIIHTYGNSSISSEHSRLVRVHVLASPPRVNFESPQVNEHIN